MCHRPRPLRVGNPKLFLRLPLLRSSSRRHARSLRTSALDYARNFTSESRLSPRTGRTVIENGGEAIAVGADVSKAADVARLFKEVGSAFGKLDVLVNNAGVFRFGAV